MLLLMYIDIRKCKHFTICNTFKEAYYGKTTKFIWCYFYNKSFCYDNCLVRIKPWFIFRLYDFCNGMLVVYCNNRVGNGKRRTL